jgi:beta-lactamase class A
MERAIGLWHRPRHYLYGDYAAELLKIIILSFGAGILSFVLLSGGVHYLESQIVMTDSTSAMATVPELPQSPLITPVVAAEHTQTDNELEVAIAAWAAKYPSQQWSVMVEDLSSGSSAAFNAEQQYDPASIYKLFATYAFAQRIPVSQWSTIKTLNGTGNHTYQECIDAMLRYSDNECGEALASQIGWSYIDKVSKQTGFTGTALNRTQGMLGTAADTAQLLKRLEQGSLVDEQVRNLMLTSLKGQKYRAGIPAGCNDCEVYNKTGDRDGFHHDAAIIHSNGHSYVLAIFSKGGSNAQIADLTHLINSYIAR